MHPASATLRARLECCVGLCDNAWSAPAIMGGMRGDDTDTDTTSVAISGRREMEWSLWRRHWASLGWPGLA